MPLQMPFAGHDGMKRPNIRLLAEEINTSGRLRFCPEKTVDERAAGAVVFTGCCGRQTFIH